MNGDVIFVRTFGDASLQKCDSIAFDAAGDVIVTGLWTQSVTTEGAYDTYIAKFKAP